MKVDLSKLKELAEKATPGPWEAKEEMDLGQYYRNSYEDLNREMIGLIKGPEFLIRRYVSYKHANDVNFLANTNPQTILKLLELIEMYELIFKDEFDQQKNEMIIGLKNVVLGR